MIIYEQPAVADFAIQGEHVTFLGVGMSRRLYTEVGTERRFGVEKMAWYLPDEPKFVLPPEMGAWPETDPLRAIFTTQAMVSAAGYMAFAAGYAARLAEGAGPVTAQHVEDARQVAVNLLPLSTAVSFNFMGSVAEALADIARILDYPPEDLELHRWAQILLVQFEVSRY